MKKNYRDWARGEAGRGETRVKNERIAMNDVCMHFVTRIIVDLSSCGLPRPSLATEFKASIYKEWTNAMAAPTRRIGSEMHAHLYATRNTHFVIRTFSRYSISYQRTYELLHFEMKRHGRMKCNIIESFTKKCLRESKTVSDTSTRSQNFFEVETIVLHNVK